MLRTLLSAGVLATALCAAALAADAPQPAAPGGAIPFKPVRESSPDWVQALGALVTVAALAWGAVYALKRARLVPTLRGARRIRLVETARLDARVTLYLVAGEGRRFLLGRCGDSLVVLRDFEAPAAASDEAAA